MDRPSGPLGAATQSTGRPMFDTPSNRAGLSSTVRMMPPGLRQEASNSSLSTQAPISSERVIALAREAMRNALEENQTKAAEASGVSNELKPRVTIDLSRENIQKLPDEVVDIIKVELERLALSHNFITSFPARFAECTSLRYLNVRNNQIREFPLPICKLSSLEILDLGRNRLRILPPELVQLTSLKVLSIQKNRIEDLPLCLADMSTLQVLKLDGNPVRFPPKEILQAQATTPPNGGIVKESELSDFQVTSQIKRFLKQKAAMDRSETESGGEESSEGTETPRAIKRVMSGRFPIKVNGTDIPDLRSPALTRAPPIPSRSHQRGLSQQNAALRRPGVMPLTIGNSNERLRSNSEGLLQASRERSERSDRSRRMGIVTKKPSELVTVEEMKLNRYSHLRGLSHGSALHGNGVNGSTISRSPASPADSMVQRGTYVRRLSSLPERKRESSSADPFIEGAQGILFALSQVHPLIQSLVGLARDGTNKRTSLERVFYSATTQVEELDRDIERYITYSEEDEEISPRTNEIVHSACVASVSAYVHVCTLLSINVDTLLNNGDPRYIRTLLLSIYGSLAEVRNAATCLFSAKSQVPRLQAVIEDNMQSTPRDMSSVPTRDRSVTTPRSRSATVVQHPTTLRVATDSSRVPFLRNGGRSATMTSSSSATPRSGESFASSATSSRAGMDFTEEDRLFDRIFLCLQQSSDTAVQTLPAVHSHFVAAMRTSIQQGDPDQLKQYWQLLLQKCSVALQNAELLKARLSLIKLKEPGIRTQTAFWELCNTFMTSWLHFASKVKEVKPLTSLLTNDVIALLRPLQKLIRETGQLIQASPWAFLTSNNQSGQQSNGLYSAMQSPASQVPLPMTPASAALGPAVQATVPSTPQVASYSTMFNGNVFERADALLSMTNSSYSRTGTMLSSGMGSSDGTITPSSMLSPISSLSGSRYGGSNGKVTF